MNQRPQELHLDLLVDLAFDAGAIAARMTGGGFGGSIVALAGEDEAAEIGQSIAERYRTRTHRIGAARVYRSADGATLQ